MARVCGQLLCVVVHACLPSWPHARARFTEYICNISASVFVLLYQKAGNAEYLQHICERALKHLKDIETSRASSILDLYQAGGILVGIIRASSITSAAGIILVHIIRGVTLRFDEEEAAAQRLRARDIPRKLRHGRHASAA